MKESETGCRILKDKPRVRNDGVWNQQRLLNLDEDTFGHQYAAWMKGYGYSADERPLVKYVANVEHAYIMQRYREMHDTVHVLLGYGTTVEEEIAIKWFEMAQTGLPMTALSAFFGPLNLLMTNPQTLKHLN